MTSDRRSFLKQASLLLGSLALHKSLDAALPPQIYQPFAGTTIPDVTKDEDFWANIRLAYACSPTLINLNNGGVCPAPRITQDALDNYNRMCNEMPSYYMWRILDQGREPLRESLAALADCSPEEIAINRNATEALNTIILGLNLSSKDEVVLGKFDYPNMINAWKQREKREGIKLVWAELELPCENDDTLVEAYTSLFTEKTKVVYLTHLINWTGQILPVRKIADEAHKRGIEVIVDGAHSFALLAYKIEDLGADYFGTSLHKWLCGPFGSGMLYIKKEKIKNIWALVSNDKPDGEDIRKFESLGTRSFPIEMAIGYSLDFHNLIGTERKQKRMHYLKTYWAEKALEIEGVKLNTSLKPKYSCAIAHVEMEGLTHTDLVNKLFADYKIHAVGIEKEYIKGVRITPNVYTTLQELDKLVGALQKIAAKR